MRAVKALDTDTAFATALSGFDPSGLSISESISELCGWAAAEYLENPLARVAYVHVLTGPSALRDLLPYLDDAGQRRALGRVVQGAAALHAVSRQPEPQPLWESDDEVLRAAEDEAEIRYLAACSVEEHSIKFAAACLLEDRLAPDRRLLLAAADGALRIAPDGSPRAC